LTTKQDLGIEMLRPYLMPNEELITNAPIYLDTESLMNDPEEESGDQIATRLNNSDTWETARVISFAFTTEGKTIPRHVAVVGIRRKK
jgi:hypothetical protein